MISIAMCILSIISLAGVFSSLGAWYEKYENRIMFLAIYFLLVAIYFK
jgi:hypothetical protein